MRSQLKIFLIVTMMILVPLQNLYADECDDDYQQAKKYLESARAAHDEKDYESAAEYYENAAEYFERIAERGECWCPKILGAAPSNAQKYYQKANECRNWTQEVKLYEEYQRAVKICTEGHNYARQRNFEDAISLFEEAAGIWEQIGKNTDSRYCQKAISEAARAREAADYARQYISSN